MAERLDLAIKPESPGPVSKQTCSRSCRSDGLLFVRSIGNGLFSTLPRIRLPCSAAFRDRYGVLLLGDIKGQEKFAMVSRGPPSSHEGGRSGLDSETVWRAHKTDPTRHGQLARLRRPGELTSIRRSARWRQLATPPAFERPPQPINLNSGRCDCISPHTLETWSISLLMRARSNR